ncbi:hypothetical protein STRIP9103_08446 [Streptomyces ipomoeae 91-03]|uniref:Transposase IS110-like N-terminal domain-containing protein n=1 Tax=Streptomyces ipomoeae 91-03 TaxID=698759 RepID=L1L610_9ACTN|nr:hypothetical protein STRIP9103_08446 [Streptomyces ipomoeae 91-03]
MRATGRQIYAINPLAAARYRDRASVSRAKSDAADARVLANICGPTGTPTGPCPMTAKPDRPSLSWPVLTRTRSGTGSR